MTNLHFMKYPVFFQKLEKNSSERKGVKKNARKKILSIDPQPVISNNEYGSWSMKSSTTLLPFTPMFRKTAARPRTRDWFSSTKKKRAIPGSSLWFTVSCIYIWAASVWTLSNYPQQPVSILKKLGFHVALKKIFENLFFIKTILLNPVIK